MFPLAKVAVKAFTTRAMPIVSLIDEEMSSSASCAISGSGKRGCVYSGTDPPGETTLDPWLDDPFPDYNTEPVVTFQNYRCPSGLICY
jgi:hypothetical protein